MEMFLVWLRSGTGGRYPDPWPVSLPRLGYRHPSASAQSAASFRSDPLYIVYINLLPGMWLGAAFLGVSLVVHQLLGAGPPQPTSCAESGPPTSCIPGRI